MRFSAGTLPTQFRKGPLALVLFLVVSAVIAYEAAQLIVTDNAIGLGISAFVLLACVGVVTVLNSWQRGVYIFFGWLMFEDFFRKYLGNNMAIYFVKDVLVIIVYLSFFLAWRAKKVQTFRPPFRVALLLFLWFCAIQVFNPASTSFFFGLMGMKMDFLYVPLMLVGYALVNSEADLRRFLTFNSILIIAIGGLGIVQSIAGPTFLNPTNLQADIRELSTTYRIAPISGILAYRPTSVFVSNGRFQDFLIVSWLLALGFGGYLVLRSRKGRFLAFAAIAIVAGASFMSASRGVFMWNIGSGLVIAAAFLWGAPWRQKEAIRAIKAIQRSLLVVGLALFALVAVFPAEFGARASVYTESLSPYSPKNELAHRIEDYPLRNFMLAFEHPRWPYGYGLGTTSLGVQYVVRITHAMPMDIDVENGWGNIIVEIGLGGLVLWLIFGTTMVIAAWRIVKQLKGSPWLPIAFVIMWYAFLLMFPMGYASLVAYQDYIMNAYLWLLIGMLFRLPSVAISAQFAAGAVTKPKPRRRWIT